jgi:hypothetical protein
MRGQTLVPQPEPYKGATAPARHEVLHHEVLAISITESDLAQTADFVLYHFTRDREATKYMTSEMDVSYEQYYYVTWSQSGIVDHNQFYEQLKAILPPRTKVYGGQLACLHLGGDGVVNYRALIVLPYVTRGERKDSWGNWPDHNDFLREKLTMVIRRKNRETGEDEDVRDTEYILFEVPRRKRVSVAGMNTVDVGYEDLSEFLGKVQARIKKDGLEKVFGKRIDPEMVSVSFCLPSVTVVLGKSKLT